MTRTLILVRHAHRDTSDRALDNGLTEKGRAQARALLAHYLEEFPPGQGPPPKVLTSPKRRCIETVAAIAERAGTRVEVSAELDEQSSQESDEEFDGRIRGFVRRWVSGKEALVIACSHGDGLPIALREATGARAKLKKGGWAEIRLKVGGRPELRSLIQAFATR
jgi:broad specificity phosphatase PhoE